jgi:hypothetical protein
VTSQSQKKSPTYIKCPLNTPIFGATQGQTGIIDILYVLLHSVNELPNQQKDEDLKEAIKNTLTRILDGID